MRPDCDRMRKIAKMSFRFLFFCEFSAVRMILTISSIYLLQMAYAPLTACFSERPSHGMLDSYIDTPTSCWFHIQYILRKPVLFRLPLFYVIQRLPHPPLPYNNFLISHHHASQDHRHLGGCRLLHANNTLKMQEPRSSALDV